MEEEIYQHLLKCSDYFLPPLAETVDIKSYAKKIFENAVTFEAWVQKDLIAMVAAYINDEQCRMAYITNVSVVNSYSGKHIASGLLKNCIQYTADKKFSEIRLKVFIDNIRAIQLYQKLNFENVEVKGEYLIMKLDLDNAE
ncbi:GNAT family N-acetyltransferase [Agriterribacter sp.]|uniref:GNAT family N-acetyltransferase n=1 Tax=Agriterribacter sp. TaxID=2821509 RepID=UPI002B9396B8|nr:GNAT family N-acetyltransferase [Agriterribacter sp.]HTN06102.1 GNAT family N-acetyltransferase [Agriterribacter sp.]